MLDIVREATCTTHLVGGESEAIQMFIFQNNRGRRPSNLEIVKAQFMHNVHLYGGSNVDILIEEIKSRFEVIYKAISSIEDYIDEDSILLYNQRAYFNSLWQTNTLDKIDEMLSKDDSVDFVMSFTRDLSTNFQHLSEFFVKHEREGFAIHSSITLGGFAIGLPFIIKAYRFGLPISKIEKLCSSLETLVLRHRLIGTRADMTSRISDVFEKFTDSNKSIDPIIERIKYLKVVDASTAWFGLSGTTKTSKRHLRGV